MTRRLLRADGGAEVGDGFLLEDVAGEEEGEGEKEDFGSLDTAWKGMLLRNGGVGGWRGRTDEGGEEDGDLGLREDHGGGSAR